MLKYVSTRGGITPVDFETAVLKGFADDGGMFVPESIPKIPLNDIEHWSTLSFNDLAFNILSLFIDQTSIPETDLKALIDQSIASFTHPDIVPVIALDPDMNHFVMELFHGPTLSFKDIAMGFLINVMDYFLTRRKERVSLLIATTGDTGPAAAYASCGKKTIDCWVMYPKGFISEEQERQMTTLNAPNVYAVSVENCPDGGDDLDLVIAQMFEDKDLVKQLNLSSVNSINWCRVMFQSIHYFYAYLNIVETIGERIAVSVPTGAFGNLFAGFLAREMGLPIKTFICANNANATIHRVLETNTFSRKDLIQTPSNAIDIALPYNYWRFLYFVSGRNSDALKKWMDEYREKGEISFTDIMMEKIKHGFSSAAVTNQETLTTISRTYENCNRYLLDPHGAVAVAAANTFRNKLPDRTKVLSLLTAHPAKFPDVIRKALGLSHSDLLKICRHQSIENVKDQFQKGRFCSCAQLKTALIKEMSGHEVISK